MTGNAKTEGRIERAARLRWVPLTRMRVNPLAQRDLNQARVNRLAAVQAQLQELWEASLQERPGSMSGRPSAFWTACWHRTALPGSDLAPILPRKRTRQEG